MSINLNQLLQMTPKQRGSIRNELTREQCGAVLEEIKGTGSQNDQITAIRGMMYSRMEYLVVIDTPIENICFEDLMKLSHDDVRAKLYGDEKNGVSGASQHTVDRLKSEQREMLPGLKAKIKPGQAWTKRPFGKALGVGKMLWGRDQTLKSANKKPHDIGLNDVLYVSGAELEERLSKCPPSKLNTLMIEATVKAQSGLLKEPDAYRFGRVIEAIAKFQTKGLEMHGELDTKGITIEKLAGTTKQRAQDAIKVMPDRIVNQLLGSVSSSHDERKLVGHELDVLKALKERKLSGVSLENLMCNQHALRNIDNYSAADIAGLQRQLVEFEKTVSSLNDWQQSIVEAIQTRAETVHVPKVDSMAGFYAVSDLILKLGGVDEASVDERQLEVPVDDN